MRSMSPQAIRLTLAAALLMAVTMGMRSSFGLFLSPLNTATGLGMATIALGAAFGQLAWGAAQPLVGALADRFGPARVITGGAVAMALSAACILAADSAIGLAIALSLAAAAGSAAGSNGLLLGAIGQRVPAAQRTIATGIVGAGGSAGQLVLGPATQATIDHAGWTTALLASALLCLVGIPLARAFRSPLRASVAAATPTPAGATVREALRDTRFWLIAGSFAACGFHVVFLTTHMPGVIASCGMSGAFAGAWLAVLGVANIAGSVAAGALLPRLGAARTLMMLYAARAAGVALFLVMPKTAEVLLGFAVWMGITYMATLPPTVALVTERFGTARLSTLIGVVMMVHQVGAFAGAWLGGVVFDGSGSYDAMWIAGIGLAAAAVLMQLPAWRSRHVSHAFA